MRLIKDLCITPEPFCPIERSIRTGKQRRIGSSILRSQSNADAAGDMNLLFSLCETSAQQLPQLITAIHDKGCIPYRITYKNDKFIPADTPQDIRPAKHLLQAQRHIRYDRVPC